MIVTYYIKTEFSVTTWYEATYQKTEGRFNYTMINEGQLPTIFSSIKQQQNDTEEEMDTYTQASTSVYIIQRHRLLCFYQKAKEIDWPFIEDKNLDSSGTLTLQEQEVHSPSFCC